MIALMSVETGLPCWLAPDDLLDELFEVWVEQRRASERAARRDRLRRFGAER